MSFQEFKDSFLGCCKQAGLSEAEIDGYLDTILFSTEKSADGLKDTATNFLRNSWKAVSGVGKGIGSGTLAAYFGIPIATGMAGGAALSALGHTDSPDIDDVRRQETIDTYRQLAHEMELRAKARKSRPTRARSLIVR